MKEYIKPTLDAIELRLEEKVARCCDEPNPGNACKSIPPAGNHPGNNEHCPCGS